MSYYASNVGSIIFKEMLPKKQIKSIAEYCFPDLSVDNHTEKDHTVLDIDSYSKYSQDHVDQILEKIACEGTIVSGEIVFRGENDEIWKFVWEGDEWCEKTGEVTYSTSERTFGNVSFSEQDVWNYLDEHIDMPEDDAFCEDVLKRCMNDPLFTQVMLETGWQKIADHAYAALYEWQNKQAHPAED